MIESSRERAIAEGRPGLTSRSAGDQPSGITRRSWSGIVLVWLAVSLPFVFLYLTSRRVVLNEIRNHAMGVAIAAAAGMNVADLESVRGPADVDTPAFRATQSLLQRLILSNPDLRYIYTMRRAQEPFGSPSAFEYIVDQPAQDFNRDGIIGPDEISEPPGKPYDAAHFPAMLEAWAGPTADRDITSDPPYPDLISGYAPVRNDNGETVALVGVDVTAATVRGKLVAIQVVMVVVWFVLCSLITLVIHLYYQQRDAFEQNRLLAQEMEVRNELLRHANDELAAFNRAARRELDEVQHAAPGAPPVRVLLDTYYMRCAASGAGLARVFDIDQDHVGLYLAEVAAGSVSTALVSSLLDMAVSIAREGDASASSTFYADLTRPEAVVRTLDDMLAKELPEDETVGLAYAVINLVDNELRVVAAGLPPPLRYNAASRRAERLACPAGPALGTRAPHDYAALATRLEDGDKLLLSARDGERMERLLGEAGAGPVEVAVAALHRGLGDDTGSLVIAQIL